MTIGRADLEKVDFSDIVDPDAPPIAHPMPGDFLREMLEGRNLSARSLARQMSVPVTRITEILHGERAITAETALRLAACFSTTAEFWMNLQTAYDLDAARRRVQAVA